MFGLNIRGAALLFNIIVVQGKVFRNQKYLQDANHVEHYQSTYSDSGHETDFGAGPEFPKFKPLYNPSFHSGNFGKMIPDWFPTLPNPDYTGPFRPIHPVHPIHPPRPDGSHDQGGSQMCQNLKGLPKPESGCCGVQVARNPVSQQRPGYPNKPWWPRFQGGRFRRATPNHEPPNRMIRGGRATNLHQLPWTAHLVINPCLPGIDSPKTCGGTIISSRYVVTAAHCLYNTYKKLSQLEVFLAEYNTTSWPDDCIIQDGNKVCIRNKVMRVDDVILHESYNDTFLQNDIALLRLSDNIPYTPFIRPICLPSADIEDLKETDIVIAGWGQNGKTESHLKQAAFVKFVSNDKCKEQYSYKDDSMFCSIGDHGEDICKGDSGGPLMAVMNNKYFLSGIVSGKRKGHVCGSSVASLFNNVFYHKNWIVKHVEGFIQKKLPPYL